MNHYLRASGDDALGPDPAHGFEELPAIADGVVDIDDPLASRLVQHLPQHLLPALDRAAPQVVAVDVQEVEGVIEARGLGATICRRTEAGWRAGEAPSGRTKVGMHDKIAPPGRIGSPAYAGTAARLRRFALRARSRRGFFMLSLLANGGTAELRAVGDRAGLFFGTAKRPL